MLAMLSREDRLPEPTGHEMVGNLLIGTAKPVSLPKDAEAARRDNKVEGNVELPLDSIAEFVSAATLDFRPAKGAKAAPKLEGFGEFPFDQVGLMVDEYRRALPSDEETGRLAPRKTREVFDSETDVKRTNENSRKK
jgi:hypothetical protein